MTAGMLLAVGSAATWWTARAGDLCGRLGWAIRFDLPGAARAARLPSDELPFLVIDIPRMNERGRSGVTGQIYLQPLADTDEANLDLLSERVTQIGQALKVRMMPVGSQERSAEDGSTEVELHCLGEAQVVGRAGRRRNGAGFVAVLVTDGRHFNDAVLVLDALTASVRPLLPEG
ncbi:MAG: hypothetical protein FLDDKLPJ_01801 [Phycisphaerae bacterium]|nr:hypothetical protein [Phycisphaerae bacterium]